MTLVPKAGRSSLHGLPGIWLKTSLFLLVLFVLSLPSFACDGHDEEEATTGQVSTYDTNASTDSHPAKFHQNYDEVRLHDLAVINNEGVRALSKNDFKVALSKFEETLKMDASYKYGRSNLGIAYNNYALTLRDKPKEALVYFEKASYIDPDNKITEGNVNAIIQMIGIEPQDFEVRENIGDERIKQTNFEGAIVEYRAALNLMIDPGAQAGKRLAINRITAKLENAYRMLASRNSAGETPYWKRLLSCDYDAWAFLSMLALYMLDLCIVVECMRRLSSKKRTWWILGVIIAAISVSAGFLLGQANAFRDVLGLLVLGLPPARALYAVTKKTLGNLQNVGDLFYIAYLAVVWIAAVPCTIFFLGWLICVVVGPHYCPVSKPVYFN